MKDDWIEWHGGECPVQRGTKVDLRFRGMEENHNTFAHVWDWKSLGLDFDIVAYRISKPAEPPKPDTSAEDALWHEYARDALKVLQPTIAEHSPLTYAKDAANLADAMLAEARKRGRV